MLDRTTLFAGTSINYSKILQDWYEAWNETAETNTEQWFLAAFPVLADGTVALMFERNISRYSNASDGNIYAETVSNEYRILIIDPNKAKEAGRYRFHIQAGYAAQVFFRNGNLYAVISLEGQEKYTALHMWPGSDDKSQVKLGKYINCSAVNSKGDIIASYYVPQGEETKEPYHSINVFLNDGGWKNFDLPHGKRVTDFTLDSAERVWGVENDHRTVFIWDGTCLSEAVFPMEKLNSIAVSDPGKAIYGCIMVDEHVNKMVRFHTNDDSVSECDIQAGETVFHEFQRASFLKNIAVFERNGWLHFVNLDKQKD